MRKIIILMTVLSLMSCLEWVNVKVNGDPMSPTFVFDQRFILSTLEIIEYKGDDNWEQVWGISEKLTGKPDKESVFLSKVKYGEVPYGYREYIAKQEIVANTLYSVGFSGGAERGGGYFAVIEEEGQVKIVNFTDIKLSKDVIARFKEILQGN